MRVYAAGSPANSPLDMIRNAPALCSSTPPTDSQSQLLIWAKWRSFLFEQSVKTGPPGIGEWIYFILRLVGWIGVSTMRAVSVCVCVCTAWPSGRALLLDPLSCFLILLLLSGSSPQGITETLESLSKILMERQEGKGSERDIGRWPTERLGRTWRKQRRKKRSRRATK